MFPCRGAADGAALREAAKTLASGSALEATLAKFNKQLATRLIGLVDETV